MLSPESLLILSLLPKSPRLVLAAIMLAILPAHATPFYWDLNGDVAGSGSASPGGTWDLTSSHWNITPGGDVTAPVVWNNSGLDTAVFAAGTDATGSYTITVDGTLLLAGLTVEEGGTVTLDPQGTGGSLDFGTIKASFNVAAGAAVISNVHVAGPSGLAKSGAGILRLNASTAPAGAYTVDGGELILGDGLVVSGTTLALGGGAGVSSTLTLGAGTVFNLAGAISFSNVSTLAALIQGGTINLNGARSVTVQNVATTDRELEIRSVIADGALVSGLTKTLAGALVLSGANTYSGNTSISAGDLIVQGNEATIASSSCISIEGGASLTVGSTSDTVAVDRIGDTASVTLDGGVGNSGANFNYNGSDFAA